MPTNKYFINERVAAYTSMLKARLLKRHAPTRKEQLASLHLIGRKTQQQLLDEEVLAKHPKRCFCGKNLCGGIHHAIDHLQSGEAQRRPGGIRVCFQFEQCHFSDASVTCYVSIGGSC